MKVLGLIEQDLDVVSKKYVDDKIQEASIDIEVISQGDYENLVRTNSIKEKTFYLVKRGA